MESQATPHTVVLPPNALKVQIRVGTVVFYEPRDEHGEVVDGAVARRVREAPSRRAERVATARHGADELDAIGEPSAPHGAVAARVRSAGVLGPLGWIPFDD